MIMDSSTPRELDLVIWGATGFTGQLATAYLSGHADKFYSFHLRSPAAPRDLKWAIAGRNRKKLEALCAATDKILVVDADDEAAIEAMVKRTRVVLGFAGPFVKFSDRVVEACCRYGTSWCDISGEIAWHRSLIDRFGDRARATGANIINHTGYDSIPSDVGTLYAVQALRSRCARPDLNVRSVVCHQIFLGGMSGGSLQTGLASETHPVALTAGVDQEHPFLLGGETAAGVRASDEPLSKARFDDSLGQWVAPFMMANINSRVVRRSNMLLDYGKNFTYREVAITLNEKQARKAEKQAGPQKVPNSVIKKMIEAGRLPKPGEGPDPATRKRSRFLSVFIATAENGESVACTISGGECGYEETAKMCCEAGLSLIYEGSVCPGVVSGGGFLTPAAALGNALINRLNNAGITFEVLPSGASATDRAKERIAEFISGLSRL